MIRFARRASAWFALLLLAAPVRAEDAVRVFAATSLTNALTEIGTRWERAGHPKALLTFAASSALARQIEAAAPADVFASADVTWMDYLDRRGRIAPGSRADLLGNRLVLIVPKGRAFALEMKPGFDFAGAFEGKLCTGEPGVVPAGIYARQSLESLGWWSAIAPRIVGTDDVRTALAFVERGECPAGIVYTTDAAISEKAEVLATFPDASHRPIVYPFALVKGARPEAAAFLDYVRGPDAAAVFGRYGFSRLP